MNNRKISKPILTTLALSLAISATLHAAPKPGSSNPTAKATASAFPDLPVPKTMTYTAVKGDSLTRLAEKFNTTRKTLRDLNNMTGDILKPGQVVQVPASKKWIAAQAAAKRQQYLAAQPVQDFDVPASTFASCPVPLAPESEEVDPADAPAPTTTPAETPYSTPEPVTIIGESTPPIAKLVSPAEMSADELASQRLTMSAPTPKLSLPAPAPAPVPKLTLAPLAKPAPTGMANPNPRKLVAMATPTKMAPATPFVTSAQKLSGKSMPGQFSPAVASADDWGSRFIRQAQMLGDRGINYDGSWRPPGEPRTWDMDCSNTSRYLYQTVAGIHLPRTASDQYYYLHLQGKAWDVPTNSAGWADGNYLRDHLKPGDLLFWENTYRPERQPPITHVMVFLGTNTKGQWIMAGSQSSGGFHNRRNGGPDIYYFRPSQACGGYTSWSLTRHVGRFCAFGRPLEADPTKMAAND